MIVREHRDEAADARTRIARTKLALCQKSPAIGAYRCSQTLFFLVFFLFFFLSFFLSFFVAPIALSTIFLFLPRARESLRSIGGAFFPLPLGPVASCAPDYVCVLFRPSVSRGHACCLSQRIKRGMRAAILMSLKRKACLII